MCAHVGDFPKDTIYIEFSNRYYALQHHNAFVLADCDDKGLLTDSYCLVQKKKLWITDAAVTFSVLLCSCPASKQQKLRLLSLPTKMRKQEFDEMAKVEKSEYCIQSHSIAFIFDAQDYPLDGDDIENDEIAVDIISLDPLLVSVFDGGVYGLVSHKRTKKLYCLICEKQCHHVAQIQDWCSSNNVHLYFEEHFIEESIFTSVSYKLIPYPLPKYLRLLHDRHEMGKHEFPLCLIPPVEESLTCVHGYAYKANDPVSSNWISRNNVTIYKEAVTIEDAHRTVYYRPTSGKCKCRQEYDGQEDLLFNLDGKHMFYYGFLLQYLHLMLEGRNPLMAFYRSSCKSFYIQSESKPVQVKLLRLAWNAFARLLDIDWKESFKCHMCGLASQTIICDGTSIGFRKDLASAVLPDTITDQKTALKGSEHADRVLLKSLKSRELLLKYSGYSKQRQSLSSNSWLSFPSYKIYAERKDAMSF